MNSGNTNERNNNKVYCFEIIFGTLENSTSIIIHLQSSYKSTDLEHPQSNTENLIIWASFPIDAGHNQSRPTTDVIRFKRFAPMSMIYFYETYPYPS